VEETEYPEKTTNESHLQTLSHDEYFVWELILNKYFTVDYFCMVQLLAILVIR
jgi:hypothetical protein